MSTTTQAPIHMFDASERYTPDADRFDNEIIAAIRPIFRRWAALGYSVRDLQYIAQHAALDESLMMLLDKRYPSSVATSTPEPE